MVDLKRVDKITRNLRLTVEELKANIHVVNLLDTGDGMEAIVKLMKAAERQLCFLEEAVRRVKALNQFTEGGENRMVKVFVAIHPHTRYEVIDGDRILAHHGLSSTGHQLYDIWDPKNSSQDLYQVMRHFDINITARDRSNMKLTAPMIDELYSRARAVKEVLYEEVMRVAFQRLEYLAPINIDVDIGDYVDA
jgi:hypothetical protein